MHIINHTGTLLGVGAGQTASFDIEFVVMAGRVGFDIEFVRAGTNVVLGSIPCGARHTGGRRWLLL